LIFYRVFCLFKWSAEIFSDIFYVLTKSRSSAHILYFLNISCPFISHSSHLYLTFEKIIGWNIGSLPFRDDLLVRITMRASNTISKLFSILGLINFLFVCVLETIWWCYISIPLSQNCLTCLFSLAVWKVILWFREGVAGLLSFDVVPS